MSGLIERIEKALDNHLPCEGDENGQEALYLASDVVHTSGNIEVAKVDREIEKIQRLERACREIQETWRSLHSDARAAIQADADSRWDDLSFHPPEFREMLESVSHHRRRNLTWVAASPEDAVRQLPSLHDALAASLRTAKKEIRKHEDAGDLDWRRVALASACRDLWTKRTGKRAPVSINPATPFGRFCEDVFGATALGTAKSAFDALKKVLSKSRNSA